MALRAVRLEKEGKDAIPFSGDHSGSRQALSSRQLAPLDPQTIEDATLKFDAESSNPPESDRPQEPDPGDPRDTREDDRGEAIGISSWTLADALLQFHLSRVDGTTAEGAGCWQASASFGRLSIDAAQELIGAPGLGADAHSLRPFAGLREGLTFLT
jgi:hypothetical protein